MPWSHGGFGPTMKGTMRARVRAIVALLTLGMVMSACGDDTGADVATSSTTTTTVVSDDPGSTAATPPTAAAPTTTITSSTDTSTAPSTTTMVTTTSTTSTGEPADEIAPPRGSTLGVIGVAHDDELNVRAGPGVDQPVVATLDPLADGIVSTGRAWRLSRSIWWEVEANGTCGWASSRYLAHIGSVTDLTSLVVERLDGRYPEAETMLDLGRIVAEALASPDPPSAIVMSVSPTVGDLGEVTYDVVGLGDDSIAGYRLHVFGRPAESQEGFELETVEATALCLRGVSSDGLCA